MGILRKLPTVFLIVIGLMAVALYPLLDRHLAADDAREQIELARQSLAAPSM